MRTAAPINPARRAIRAFNTLTAAWNTKRRAGAWSQAASASHNTLGLGLGTLRLLGKRPIETFPISQIKRVQLVARADGEYVPCAVQADWQIEHEPTGRQVGVAVGLKGFYMDSKGASVANPRFLRKAEAKLKRLHRRKDRKQKGGKNRKKAITRLARGSSPRE